MFNFIVSGHYFLLKISSKKTKIDKICITKVGLTCVYNIFTNLKSMEVYIKVFIQKKWLKQFLCIFKFVSTKSYSWPKCINLQLWAPHNYLHILLRTNSYQNWMRRASPSYKTKVRQEPFYSQKYYYTLNIRVCANNNTLFGSYVYI